tara:strand:+ start:342 stop:1091 length:750 start_codon:yes stop_codon:yes gene_type:complete
LLWILVTRDLKVRYKQTVVGGLWTILQPLATMMVFTALFQLLKRVPASDGAPYAVTLLCALLPWQLFASSLTQSNDSLVNNQNLVTKVYVPRLLFPITPVLAGLVDFAISFVVLIAIMAWYGVTPTATVFYLPIFVVFAMATSLALGLWLSALNAMYRDFRYVLPFSLQIGFFVSPVVFETTALIPERWQLLYSLNPMVGVIEGFRWVLLGKAQPPIAPVLVSALVVSVLLAGGVVYFRRMEKSFADCV